MLDGYSKLIFEGALVTLELALFSVLLSVVIGLMGAGGKLSSNRLVSGLFECYTTLIRGVPDLVLMLLIFYGLQITLNSITESLGFVQIDIDPLSAGLSPLALSMALTSLKRFVALIWRSLKGKLRPRRPLVLPPARSFVALCSQP